MEETVDKKIIMETEVKDSISRLTDEELSEKRRSIEHRLYEFANFMESKIVLMYLKNGFEFNTREIIKKCFEINKVVVLPVYSIEKHKFTLMKI